MVGSLQYAIVIFGMCDVVCTGIPHGRFLAMWYALFTMWYAFSCL